MSNLPATCILDKEKLPFDMSTSNYDKNSTRIIQYNYYLLDRVVGGHEERDVICSKYTISPSSLSYMQTSKPAYHPQVCLDY